MCADKCAMIPWIFDVVLQWVTKSLWRLSAVAKSTPVKVRTARAQAICERRICSYSKFGSQFIYRNQGLSEHLALKSGAAVSGARLESLEVKFYKTHPEAVGGHATLQISRCDRVSCKY